MANPAADGAEFTKYSGQNAAYLATVSGEFLEDWHRALRAHCGPVGYAAACAGAGFSDGLTRVTHDQIVTLYRAVVAQTGDEMMGLWSRPIRPGALKYLCTAVLEARTLSGALHRFVQYWNLLLDDAELSLHQGRVLQLRPRDGARLNRFGQMLLLKLAHGVLSWLAGRELAVQEVAFDFPRPGFGGDYAVIFPAPVRFGDSCCALEFAPGFESLAVPRHVQDLGGFLATAPRDWIFTRHVGHALQLRLRDLLQSRLQQDFGLSEAAASLGTSPRSLSRALAAEGMSFQSIKDGLRRDIAIRDLSGGQKPVSALAWDLGFSSVAVFTRAFRAWTGETPAAWRRRVRSGAALRRG